jgi:hypothetical protein
MADVGGECKRVGRCHCRGCCRKRTFPTREVSRANITSTLTWTDDRLEVLIILVEAYEQDHHPIGLPDPIEAIKARMEDLGLQRDDLCILLGVDRGLAKDTGWP